MYSFYKFFSGFSKFFSNMLLVLAIPAAVLLCALGWCMFFIKDIGIAITGNPDLFELAGDGSNKTLIDSLEIVKWIGLGLGIFMILSLVIMFVSWIIKKILFKKIASQYIARNKEWRNRDINKAIEKLETYRYRE